MNSRSMWQMSRAAGFAFVLALLPVATSAQRTGEEFTRALDRFTLFTNCAPVTLSVWLEGDTVPGLTDESVTRAVRSRLRSARIYDEDSEYLLRAYFHVVGRAFHLSVELLKPLYDLCKRGALPCNYMASVCYRYPQPGWQLCPVRSRRPHRRVP